MKLKVEKRGVSDLKRLFRNSDQSVRESNGDIVTMAKAKPVDRRTADQTAARESMRAAGQAWKALAESDRAQWQTYARQFGGQIAEQRYKDLSGWDVFLPAWTNRTLLEESTPESPMTDEAPPPPVTALEEVGTDDPTTFSFRVTSGAAPEGHVLVVRITPKTPTRARQPYSRTARMIRGYSKESTAALPPSGGVVTFTGAQFAVNPGERFGVAMRIVRVADGVHSREFFADLYRGEGTVAGEQG